MPLLGAAPRAQLCWRLSAPARAALGLEAKAG
jgi:hypothetical protein